MSEHNCSVSGWNSACLQSVYSSLGPKHFANFHIKALLRFAIKGTYSQGGHVEGANCVQLRLKKPQRKGSKWNHSNELWADPLILMLRTGQKCLSVTSNCDCVRELGVTSHTKDVTITPPVTPPPGRWILADSREHCLLLHHQPRTGLAKNIFQSVTVTGKQNICNNVLLQWVS